ncbi:MAG: hypothetical protein V3U03_00370, partial [Myxococcota bacterium]
YPPLPMLVSAASMWLGSGFDVPTYLAPRYAGMLVAVLSVCALYGVTRWATASATAGFLAGLVMIGFSQFAAASISNLEPKMLVAFFMLLAGAALQRRRWWAAGVASALAATCYWPALLVGVAAFVVSVRGGRRRRIHGVREFAAGALLGVLPVVIYLTATDAWADFWQRVEMVAALRTVGARLQPLAWLGVIDRHAANERVFYAAAAIGFSAFAIRSLRGGPAAGFRAWLHPRLAGVPVATALWIAYACVDSQGGPDLLPLQPLVAFWAAWGASRLIGLMVSYRRAVGWRASGAQLALLLFAAVGVATAAYGFGDAFLYRPAMTLRQQEDFVRDLTARAGTPDRVWSFSAEEVYVLAERRAPLPPRIALYTPFLSLVRPGGCGEIVREVVDSNPGAVVIHGGVLRNCMRSLHSTLVRRGYEPKALEISLREHASFRPTPSDLRSITWYVYAPSARENSPATSGARAPLSRRRGY